jgi:hypothetical protein
MPWRAFFLGMPMVVGVAIAAPAQGVTERETQDRLPAVQPDLP